MGGNLSHNADELRRAKEGDRLRFRRKWFYSHYGVYIGNEELIHLAGIEDDGSSACNYNPMHVFTICGQRFNKAEVKKDNVWNVIKGSKVYIDNEKDEEKTPRSPSEIVKKASSMIGPIEYNVLYNNCEHFATFCRYDVKESEQVQNAMKVLIIGILRGMFGSFTLSRRSPNKEDKNKA